LLAAASVGEHCGGVLEPVLEIADSLMTYRRLYFADPRLAGILELLLRDDSNPRSLLFQLNVLREHCAALVVDPKTANPDVEQSEIEALAARVSALDLNPLVAAHDLEQSGALTKELSQWVADIAALSDAITNHYFSHTIPRVT